MFVFYFEDFEIFVILIYVCNPYFKIDVHLKNKKINRQINNLIGWYFLKNICLYFMNFFSNFLMLIP